MLYSLFQFLTLKMYSYVPLLHCFRNDSSGKNDGIKGRRVGSWTSEDVDGLRTPARENLNYKNFVECNVPGGK